MSYLLMFYMALWLIKPLDTSELLVNFNSVVLCIIQNFIPPHITEFHSSMFSKINKWPTSDFIQLYADISCQELFFSLPCAKDPICLFDTLCSAFLSVFHNHLNSCLCLERQLPKESDSLGCL